MTSQLVSLVESPHTPPIKQKQFIQLWKSLYGLYPDEEASVIEIYSAIGRFGAHVTKMGEGSEPVSQQNAASPPGEGGGSSDTELGHDAVETLCQLSEDITVPLNAGLSSLQTEKERTDNLNIEVENNTCDNTNQSANQLNSNAGRSRPKLTPQPTLVTLVSCHNKASSPESTASEIVSPRESGSQVAGQAPDEKTLKSEEEWELPFLVLCSCLRSEPVIYQFFQNFTPLNTNIR